MVKIGGIQKFSTVDYPGYACAAIFTIGCNMRCGYCHNPELVLPEQFTDAIPEKDILDFLETRVGLLEAVAISGGEPTIHSDLPDFIRKIKKMNFKVKLDSNGLNPDMLQKLFDEKLVDFVAMDIKGPLEKYIEIAARPIDIEAIKRSIELIKKNVYHEFRTTVVREQLSPQDFEKVGQVLKGAKRFALQHFISKGDLVSNQFKNYHTFSEDEFAEAKKIMEKYVETCVVH